MNEIQRLMVEKGFYSLSNIPNTNCDQIKDQLLLYICNKSRVKKSRVVHGIELRCTLLLQDLDLVIIALTDIVVDNIGGNTIYTSLAIGIRNRYKKSNTISNL